MPVATSLRLLKSKITQPFVKKQKEISFQPSAPLTLGAEIELQLMDKQTLNLTPRAEEILKATVASNKVKPEFYLSTLEINTGICQDVQSVESDFKDTLSYLTPIVDRLGIVMSTTGCHPFARYADCIISPTARYNELIDRNQWLTRRMTVYGLHIHLGMKSGDECIRFNNFFVRFLPHLLALSASSPFWQGDDTGLSSCRPTTYEALPTAGQPYSVTDWRDFENLYDTLTRCGAIRSLKDLWWDIRPSPGYGTLEIRVCDGLATLSEALAIIAFVHGLAHWFNDHGNWAEHVSIPPYWIARENKWRSIRHGLEADLITSTTGSFKPIRQDIEDWLVTIAPYTKKLGYEQYISNLREILYKGTSSERQRRVFQATSSLEAVAAHNVAEFQEGVPHWGNAKDAKSA